MKKSNFFAIIACILLVDSKIHPYTVNASTFYRPRPKTLRKIRKNVALSIAIQAIQQHPLLSQDNREILISLPLFISHVFTHNSIIQTHSGKRIAIQDLLPVLKKLEENMRFIQAQSQENQEHITRILESLAELLQVVERFDKKESHNKP